MQVAFQQSLADANRDGRPAIARTWLREIVGMVRFGSRERLSGWLPFGSPRMNDIRWAWRGVRSRGWRAAFVVGLFGIVLAANAVVFAAADAFVLRTVPYADPDRLVVFQTTSTFNDVSDYTNRDPILEWRKHTDLFVGIHAHNRGPSAYITVNGVTEVVRSQRVTPGLFELLGVVPTHGRPFVAGDAEPGAPPTVVIASALARRLFHDETQAVGRTLDGVAGTPTVIGVMPADFRFPTAVEQFWMPLDLPGVRHNVGQRAVARLQPGWTLEAAAQAHRNRVPVVAANMPEESKGRVDDEDDPTRLVSLASFLQDDAATSIFGMLLGAGACLLLIACANVASLELATSAVRTRTLAVRSALGASRASLIRVSMLEAGLLIVGSLGLAAGLAVLGLDVLTTELTTTMRESLTNPLDVDARLLAFMAIVTTVTFGITTVPSVLQLSRLSVVAGLRHDPRTMPVSRGAARSRQWLMTAQVALTVVLLSGAVLYVRTYQARIGVDKGFNSSGLATLAVFRAPDATEDAAQLGAAILERVRALPGVQAVSQVGMLPPSTQAGAMGPMTIAGRESVPVDVSEWPMVSLNSVDPEYFRTMSIVAVEGRLFDATTRQDQIVIDERFAKRYWPNESAIGARFNIGGTGQSGVSMFEVVGVSRSLRQDRTHLPSGQEVFAGFIRRVPTSSSLNFVVRMDDARRLNMLADAARSISPRLVVRVDTVEARYRRLEADNRLAAAITSGFGTLAWIVAAAGIYAVMAFLVSGRTREIGVRMALGADRPAIRSMILSSSLRFVALGVGVGLATAGVASQWIGARLFDVSPLDPVTYLTVAAIVVATALVATWLPARRAAQVDPATTLRAE
jgi:predicted permease